MVYAVVCNQIGFANSEILGFHHSFFADYFGKVVQKIKLYKFSAEIVRATH